MSSVPQHLLAEEPTNETYNIQAFPASSFGCFFAKTVWRPEMEGWVLLDLKTLKSQHTKHIEVIIIKGVADYGNLSMEDKWQ